ncbi:winged helix-turn-helix transcriptional regulator [bacterium]|nr:winged helix-turn-helix transcriptional regulator [bacterium]MCI0604858.1 winged helix-turn-helix transcriptional regulator [bacterium]
MRVSYVLTEAGKSLQPVIQSLGEWADRWDQALIMSRLQL